MSGFFEDMEEGARLDLGSYTFTADSIIRFAGKFDPQPFHMSEDEAARSHFGRLCASGWHTASVYMKLLVATHQAKEAAAEKAGIAHGRYGPSPGFEQLKWLKPVYAGDTVTYHSIVTGKKASASRPGWGLVFADNHGVNQNGTPVFFFKSKVFLERRPART
ncbi:acyl dehydratase [Roseibium aquae]|uniref:Acyl dehydratase n=1 Tax=Roseibium aquae TaxID=1323746 RepID=A0A916T8P6_9HYPH|nr:MaoC family dehydratase [Roseibium aquae]GGB34923.1 acyl dehydratase [Roseibium aquae]